MFLTKITLKERTVLGVLNEDYAKREGQCWVFLTKITLEGRTVLGVLNEDYAKGKDGAGCS